MCTGSLESQLCPGLQAKQVGSKVREGVLPLYSALVRPHLECCSHVRDPQHSTELDLLEWVQGKAMKVVRGLEHLSYEERLRRLRLFSLEEKRLRGDVTVTFQSLNGAFKKAGERLFASACCDRTRGNISYIVDLD